MATSFSVRLFSFRDRRLSIFLTAIAVLGPKAWAVDSVGGLYGSIDKPLNWCERALEKVRAGPSELEQKIAADLMATEVPSRVTVAAKGQAPDGPSLVAAASVEVPELLVFDWRPSRTDLSHEVRTARDYAKFLARHRGRQFLYVGDFMGRSVPLFDGVVLSREDLLPLYNVSLKYASHRFKEAKIETLIDSMMGRLNYDFELYGIVHPADWFRKVSNRESLGGVRSKKYYSENLLRARLLMTVFGLYQGPRAGDQWLPTSRELHTVVDVRDHGYPISFFRQPEVQQALLEVVRSMSHQRSLLTLLWDADRVVEVDQQEVRVFELPMK